jgi:phosphate transport system substrate-binding protein
MRRISWVLLAVLSFAVAACGKNEEAGGTSGASSDQPVTLNAAGATFPFPLYSKWMHEYNRIHPNIRINYQSIGSGGGIRQITAGTVDFGASDAPMTPDEEKAAPATLFHIPTTLGAVCITYNIAGVTSSLNITPDVLADIYLGKLTKWNDPRLTKPNPSVKLPDTTITVVHRSDGSGTTNVFTDYLSKVSSDWKTTVGMGKSVKWPTGLGGKGNEGVTGQVKTTPGAIGYVELAYAMQNKLPVAAMQNKAGQFVKPSIPAITEAAAGVDMPPSLHVSITDPTGKTAYPISAFTYLLVYQKAKDPVKGSAIAHFVWWAIHDGQKYSAALDYAPLPESVVKKEEARLKDLTAGGKKIL